MKYRKTDQVIARQVAGETLLVPVKGRLAELHRLFTLNPVAEWVWEHLDGRRTTEEICTALVAQFEVSRDIAERDLAELLDRLQQSGLIEAVGETTP